MLPAGQRSQLPGVQPAHSERSASWLHWGRLLQLGHAGCRGAEFKVWDQRVCGCRVADSRSLANTPGGQREPRGLGIRGLHPWAFMCS